MIKRVLSVTALFAFLRPPLLQGREVLKMKRTSTTVRICLLLGILLAVCGLRTMPADTRAPSTDTSMLWYAVEKVNQVQLARVDEVEPEAVAGQTQCAPGSVAETEQTCDPIARGEAPIGIAIHPDGGRAYVINRSTDNLFMIDLVTNKIVEVIDLYPEAEHLLPRPRAHCHHARWRPSPGSECPRRKPDGD